MVEMELLGVQVELPSNSPLLLLREMVGQGRVLPVVIDTPEAHAIHRGIEGDSSGETANARLLVTMLEDLQATVALSHGDRTAGAYFFAEIELEVAGQRHSISARPSDAIAIAVGPKRRLCIRRSFS